jgi:hypothetical protein
MGMRRLGRTALAVGALIAGAQGVRFARTNPPVRSNLAAPIEVVRILRHACYDCHSNETEWPWYSVVAPASWIVHREVTEGRRRLNFSDWEEYASDPDTAARKLGQIATFVANGDMAPWYYVMLHPTTRLTGAQRAAVIRWAQQAPVPRPSANYLAED